MTSDLSKPKFFSYVEDAGHDCKVRLLLHGNPSANKQQNGPPKTYVGKIRKIPIVPVNSPVDVKSGTAPPVKGSGERPQLVMGPRSSVGVISGLPPPSALKGSGERVQRVLGPRSSVGIISGLPPPSSMKGSGERAQLVMGPRSSVGILSGFPPPSAMKVSGERAQIVMGPRSSVSVISGLLPPSALKGSGDLVPVVMPQKPPFDVQPRFFPRINGEFEKVPMKTVTKTSVATSTSPDDIQPEVPPTVKGTNGVVPIVTKKLPVVSYKSPVHVKPGVPPPVKGGGRVIPMAVKAPVDVKPGVPVAVRGGGETIPLVTTSKPSDVKSGVPPPPYKAGEMVPYVTTSAASGDVKSGTPTPVTDVWIRKSSIAVSKVSPVGSSSPIFVPVHVISSQAQKPLPQMQLVTSQVQNPHPQVQILNSQVENHPPQLQLKGTQGQKHPSQLQLLSTQVQKPYAPVQILASKAQVQNPNSQAQLLTSQAQVSVPQMVTTSQKYIMAPSSQQLLGPTQVLTTTHSQLIAAPTVVSSIGGNVTTVLRTVASPQIVTTSAQKVGSGLNSIPKIITGRLKPVQIIMHDVIDRTPKNIPIVDLKDEEPRDSEDKVPKTFQCAECSLHFSSKKELERHEDNHLGEVNYICDQCGKEFSTKRSLEDHLKFHASEKKFECDVCHKRFDYRDNLIFHMRIHGEVKNISIKCPICQKKFGNKSMRDIHMKKHSVEERNKHKICNNETTQASSPEKKETVFGCDVCDKTFPDKVALENHKVVHIKFERGPKLEVKKKPATVEATISPHECRSCLTVFNSDQSLRTHTATCGKVLTDTIVCAFCKKHYGIFKQSKDDGSQGMKFICEPCCTFLAQKSQVSGFTPRLENRFICNKCDKCFSNEVQLREHLRSHMPGKPVRCDLCSKNFGSLRALQVHRAARHAKKGALVSQTSHKIGFVANLPNSKTGETLTNSPLGVASSVRRFSGRRRKKRKRIERSKARNRKERLEYERRTKQKMLERSTESQVPHKRPRYDFEEVVDKGSSTEDADESISEAEEGKANSYEDDDEEYDSDLALGVPYEEDDDDDDDDFLETDLNVPLSDDDEEEEEDDDDDADFLDKEDLKNLEVTIKQEPVDNDENKTKVMENCTVFNAVPSKGKVSATALVIPDRVIKEEKPDEYEELDVQIKQEKETLEEMAIKEENVTIKEENLFAGEENDLESLQFPIKEEKVDESELVVEEEFEFTPFGGPLKEEPLGL
ncbi:uncharacterized protein [Macrobrachium rosenbergii]|uniref:uncharacterized protein isoform X6 n=1 Tax=Macrobrachium rosenbergii TaxID=79674 RepID=UPI0034D4ACA0